MIIFLTFILVYPPFDLPLHHRPSGSRSGPERWGGCFVLRQGWQPLYLLLSDRIVFDLQLLRVFRLCSNDLSPQTEAAPAAPPLPGFLRKVWGKCGGVQMCVVVFVLDCVFIAWPNTHTCTRCTYADTIRTHDVQCSIHPLRLKFGLGPCYTASECWSEYISLPPSQSLSSPLVQSACLLAAHITESPQTAIKTDVLHWLCVRSGRE